MNDDCLVITNTSDEIGKTVSKLLLQKKSNYKASPQKDDILNPNPVKPCNILADFFRVIFHDAVNKDPIGHGIEFFTQDELESPGRFDPTKYAVAFDAGIKNMFPNLPAEDQLLKVADALYIVYGDTSDALIKVAEGLIGLFDAPLSSDDKIAIGVVLVRLVLLKGIEGLGELGRALDAIGFDLNDIPNFLRNEVLLRQILSTIDIGKELLPLLIADIPLLVTLLDNPILWPGLSPKEREKAILFLLWEDLGLKNQLELFQEAFTALNFVTAEMIAEIMKIFLNATVLETVGVLQGLQFPVDEITLTIFALCSNPSDSLSKKIDLFVEIFKAMTMPVPSNDEIADAIVNINDTTSLLSGVNVFEVIAKVLNKLIPEEIQDKLNAIAMVLQTLGQSALQITELFTLINVAPVDIAEILLMLNFDVVIIVQSLVSVNVSNKTITDILIGLGISAQDIAKAFQDI